jgi:hypothetical protein
MSVQPMGRPIRASTQAGLSGPGFPCVTTSLSGLALSSILLDDGDFQSLAAGVGQFVTAVRRFSPPSRPEVPGPPIPSAVVGVGQSRIASDNVVPEWCFEFGSVRLAVALRPFRASFTTGVGHSACLAIVSRLGRTGPTRPAAPPWFVP